MDYETKVLVVFAAIVLAMNVAVTVFGWVKTRDWPDRTQRIVFLLWKQISSTLIILGALIGLLFRSDWAFAVGMAMVAVGILLLLGHFAYSIVYLARHRNP